MMQTFNKLALVGFAIATGCICAAQAPMPTIDQMNAQLDRLEPECRLATLDTSRAESMVFELDDAERSLAKVASASARENPKLVNSYARPDKMLRALHDRYKAMGDECA